ncbi:hypothetical protein AgCh_001037 [Apium graveolens]
MDRLTWMYKIPRVSHAYVNGVNEFIACAVENLKKKQIEHRKEDRITCPCHDCYNLKKYPNIDTVREHLFCRGFMEDYTKWIWHGEGIHTRKTETSSKIYESYGDSMPRNEEDDVENDRVEEMIQDVEEILVHQPEVLENLVDDYKRPLYHGCNVQFTRLSTTLKLCKLKVKNGWSDKSFTEMLKLLAEMLPAKNELPTSTYEAKKILCPMVEQFRRLFANSNDAKLVRWHVEGRKSDGMLRHPADSPQWRTIDGKFPEFGGEVRNLRLGLCANGMNPYRTLSSTHSTWPVLLTIYNLPPWLCMKRKYIMLTLLIPGPKEAGNNIDVYLQPLMEDLKLLWDQGYTIKGAKACPICEDAMIDLRLKNCKKNVYMGHRTFLPLTHPYRKRKNDFDGTIETRVARFPLTGKEVFERVKDIDVVLGKLYKKPTPNSIWKKRSIFWDLPYWEHLQVRHCLDFMHIEKNVCESIIRTLLNIPGKTKDGMKARLDLKEKISFYECLSSVKVPSGDSSSPKKPRLNERLEASSKVIDPLTLDKLQADIIVTLYEFEMYFLHSFFDIMVHLVTHLVREIKICGPLYVRQMYPFERFLCILKAYVRNRRHPEASIVEGYSVEETIEFCTDYLASTDPVGISRSRHEGRLDGQGTVGHKMITPGAEMLDRAHLFVLQHMTEVNPHLQEHILEIRRKNPSKGGKWVTNEHNRSFVKWFKDRVMSQYSKSPSTVSNTLKWLAYGPNMSLSSFQGYDVNGYSFYTQHQDNKSTVQNSGISVEAFSTEFERGNSIASRDVKKSYYGVIEEI